MTHGSSCDVEIWRPSVEHVTLGLRPRVTFNLGSSYFHVALTTVRHLLNACIQLSAVVKVDRRIRWHYTTTILRLRIGARLTRYRNCKFHNGCLTISRHADGISRYSVPPSAGPLLPLTKRVLYADLHVELRSHLSLLWNWRAISSHV